MQVHVRFAPSPTGIPHVGNIRTALFDYFYARHNKGTFTLRIEDTDQERKVVGAIEAIKESLTWLGAEWDDFVVQSERLPEYKKYAEELVNKNAAKVEENGAIRYLVRERGIITWQDVVGNRSISYNADDLRKDEKGNPAEGFIILKADGYPTYHLASVVDDHLMGITHVIRGDDWMPSTPRHLLLYKDLGWDAPKFAHVPNVTGPDGKKFSKREGAKSVLEYRDEGYLPEALLNYLMLLGWAPKNDKTIVSKQTIIDEFTLEKVKASPAAFDISKLDWMNGQYMRNLDTKDFAKRLLEFDPASSDGFSEKEFLAIADNAKSRIKTLAEFKSMADPYRSETPPAGPSELKAELKSKLESLGAWENDSIFKAIKEILADKNLKLPDLYEALIGKRQGLTLSVVFEAIGRDKTLSLLN